MLKFMYRPALKRVSSYLFFLCLFFTKVEFLKASAKIDTGLDSTMVIAIRQYNQGNYAGALNMLKAILLKAEQTGNDKAQCKALNNIGNCYSHTSKADSSLYYYQAAYKVAEKERDTVTMGKLLKNIGALYVESLNDFTKGLEYYDKAEVIALKAHDSALLADCYNNKGIVFEQQKKYDAALDFYTRALKMYQAQGNKERVAISLINTGIVYKYLKQYPQAIADYKQSIQISQALKDSFMVAANLNNLGNVYSQMGDHRKAADMIMQSIAISRKINEKLVLLPALDGLSDEYEAMGNYDLAYKTRKEYEDEKFSAMDTDRSRTIAQLEVKYQTGQKEASIKMLKQQGVINTLKLNEARLASQKKNYLLAISAVIILALFFIGYFYFSNMRIKAQQMRAIAIRETEEKERIRMAKDIHDDMGSGLSKIKVLTEIMSNKLSGNKDVETGMKSITETSNNLIENMRDLLWMLDPENTTLDSLISRIREYGSDYLADFPVEYITNIVENVPEMQITEDAYRNIFSIVKECLQNSIKHSQACEVKVDAKTDDTYVHIIIADNGIGFDKGETSRGNGLRNMKYRAEALGGMVNAWSEPGKGTSITVNIPLSNIRKNSLLLS